MMKCEIDDVEIFKTLNNLLLTLGLPLVDDLKILYPLPIDDFDLERRLHYYGWLGNQRVGGFHRFQHFANLPPDEITRVILRDMTWQVLKQNRPGRALIERADQLARRYPGEKSLTRAVWKVFWSDLYFKVVEIHLLRVKIAFWDWIYKFRA